MSDPSERRTVFLTMAIFGVIGGAWKGTLHANGAADVIAFVVFLVVVYWLLGPRKQTLQGGGGGSLRQQPTFLLGKALKGIWRGRDGRAIAARPDQLQ